MRFKSGKIISVTFSSFLASGLSFLVGFFTSLFGFFIGLSKSGLGFLIVSFLTTFLFSDLFRLSNVVTPDITIVTTPTTTKTPIKTLLVFALLIC